MTMDKTDARAALPIIPLFATPISNFQWPESEGLNAELAAYVLQLERADAGLSRSNVGGWHSKTDLFADDRESCLQVLRARVRSYVTALARSVAKKPDDPVHERFRLEAWANVLRRGHYHSLHSHPNAYWSGVYYVTGNPEPEADHPFSGKLELIDPRPGASLSYSESTALYARFLVNPSAGQMVVFPGWLQHLVHPYFGSAERITVAFNATPG